MGGRLYFAGYLGFAWSVVGIKRHRAPAPAAQEHFWSHKNGNASRNGQSIYTATADLTAPLWEWTVPGHTATQGYIEASPLIDKDSNVYLATTTGGIFSLDRSGAQRWEHHEPARAMTGALAGTSLYVGTSSGVALSIDLQTGDMKWRTQYCAGAGGDAWTATAANGLVIFPGANCNSFGYPLSAFGGNNEILALNSADGQLKWKYHMGTRMIYNFMPVVLEDRLLFIDASGRLYCLSLLDGALLWEAPETGHGFTTAGVALGPYEMVYTMFNTQGSEGGVLKAYDVHTGAERWSAELGLEASAAPVVGKLGPDGRVGVVVGAGKNQGPFEPRLRDGKADLRAFDAKTGEHLWTFTTPSNLIRGSAGEFAGPGQDSIPDTWSTAAIGSDGTIYVGWQGGTQYALEGATGKIISSYHVGWGDQGEPAIGDGFVVIPSIGKVVAFGTK